MKRLFAVILVMFVTAIFGVASVGAQQSATGWVDGSNKWNQDQYVNLVPKRTGGSLGGGSNQTIEMWGGAGAGTGDPASYTSQLMQGQSTNVLHAIPGGEVRYGLDEVQLGFIDLTANPGETKGISVGGKNTTNADIYTSRSSWMGPAKCAKPASTGAATASGGTADLNMVGWVSGVQPGDKGEYRSVVVQQIAHKQAQNIPGGNTKSFSESVQIGSIDIVLD